MKMSYRIRFHLARGEHYKHWQIKNSVGSVVYVDPSKHSIVLKRCILHIQLGACMKVFNGGSKRPCAWVIAESFKIIPFAKPRFDFEVAFNPRLNLHWALLRGHKVIVKNIDKSRIDLLVSSGRSLFADLSSVISSNQI
jgi:hypothetical protein